MPVNRQKYKKARFSLYLSTRNYKLFMAVCKLLSTSLSAEVDKMILAKLLLLSKDSSSKQITSLISSSNIDLLDDSQIHQQDDLESDD